MAPTLEGYAFQVLESCEADFEKMTWTFTLPSNGRVSAGYYAVMPTEKFMEMSGDLAHAQGLLRRILQGEVVDGKFIESIAKHFDPKPL